MMKVILVLVLLAAAAFCAVGFAATFEPMERSVQLRWRTSYAIAGVASIGGVALVLMKSRRARRHARRGERR